jgi:hypothetical protein
MPGPVTIVSHHYTAKSLWCQTELQLLELELTFSVLVSFLLALFPAITSGLTVITGS